MYETEYKTLRYSRHMGRELAFLTLSALISQPIEVIERYTLEDLLERSVRVLVTEAEEQYKEFGQTLELSQHALTQMDTDISSLTPQNAAKRTKKVQEEHRKVHSALLAQIEVLAESLNAFSQTLSIPLLRTISDKPNIREFAIALVKGYIEHGDHINTLIDEVSTTWPVERMLYIDRDIIRVAAIELCYDPSANELHGDSTPMAVVINEAVELAKKYGSPDSFRFVNGVLRELMPHAEKMRRSK